MKRAATVLAALLAVLVQRRFEDVPVPAENVILPVGKGLQGALMAIDIASCCFCRSASFIFGRRWSADR